MASDRAIRIRRANADIRIYAVAEALAAHLNVLPPNYSVKKTYPGNLREAMIQEQTAALLESIADELGVEVRNRRRLVPITADPTATESLILTDDAEENERRQADHDARARAFRILRGEEKPDTQDNEPPVQQMHRTNDDAYDPSVSKEGAYLFAPDFVPTPDPHPSDAEQPAPAPQVPPRPKNQPPSRKGQGKHQQAAAKAAATEPATDPEQPSTEPLKKSAEQSGQPVPSTTPDTTDAK